MPGHVTLLRDAMQQHSIALKEKQTNVDEVSNHYSSMPWPEHSADPAMQVLSLGTEGQVLSLGLSHWPSNFKCKDLSKRKILEKFLNNEML